MEWPPEPETAEKIVWYMAAGAFLIAIVSAIGEYRGWWNFIGELGMTFGTIVGGLLTALGVFITSSRRQVGGVHQAVLDNGGLLRSMDGKLDKLEGMDRKLGKLDKLDDLDKVQLELDVQTGVLGGQLAVLQEIRDAS